MTEVLIFVAGLGFGGATGLFWAASTIHKVLAKLTPEQVRYLASKVDRERARR